MIQPGTIVNVIDKSGVSIARCIKVIGHYKKKIAVLGEVIIVVVQEINLKRFRLVRKSKQKRFVVGTIHRAIVLHCKKPYIRSPGISIVFGNNSVVITNKRIIPMSNRVFGPILRELCMMRPSLGCISKFII